MIVKGEVIMNDSIDRITTAKNRVFYSDGLGIGRNNPISLHTSNSSIYRVTGMDQLADIVNCGYVRPKEGRVKGGHENEVFWSIGGEKTFYYDKRPVIETSVAKVKDGQIGSLSLNDLSAIWVFDYEQNAYTDKISLMKQIRETIKKTNGSISGEQIRQALIGEQIEKSNRDNLEQFLKVSEIDRQKMSQLREQQLMSLNQSILTDENIVGKAR